MPIIDSRKDSNMQLHFVDRCTCYSDNSYILISLLHVQNTPMINRKKHNSFNPCTWCRDSFPTIKLAKVHWKYPLSMSSTTPWAQILNSPVCLKLKCCSNPWACCISCDFGIFLNMCYGASSHIHSLYQQNGYLHGFRLTNITELCYSRKQLSVFLCTAPVFTAGTQVHSNSEMLIKCLVPPWIFKGHF